jgi:hypothetical protein
MKHPDDALTDAQIDDARPAGEDGLSAFVRAGGMGDEPLGTTDLRDERMAFHESHSIDAFLTRFEENDAPPSKPWWEVFLASFQRRAIPAFAAAGALVLALAILPTATEAPLPSPADERGVRSKGLAPGPESTAHRAMANERVELGFELLTPEGAVRGLSGSSYREGDHLRFSYSLEAPGHLYLISLDNRGTATPFYPSRWDESVAVPPGKNLPLEASIQLDDYLGYEGFIAVFSHQPIPGKTIQDAAREAFLTALENGGDIRAIHRLPGLGDAAQISMWIEKVAH